MPNDSDKNKCRYGQITRHYNPKNNKIFGISIYSGNYAKSYFWRTTGQQEIDYIEEKDGRFTLFEIKSNPKKANTKLPKVFMENYDVEKTAVITPTNWTEWLI